MDSFETPRFKKQYRIGSNRLKDWDYSSDGAYFVTICTWKKLCYLGEIRNKIMGLSDLGCSAVECWQAIPDHFPDVVLDEWVVMPNHVHGIIFIQRNNDVSTVQSISSDTSLRVETRHGASLPRDRAIEPAHKNKFGPLQKGSLSAIINQYKGAVTRWAKKQEILFSWQSNYHDHIIRSDAELNRIRAYIQQNPENWGLDENDPDYLFVDRSL